MATVVSTKRKPVVWGRLYLHVCPGCRSRDIERAARRTSFERWVLPIVRLRPYRCLNCGRRFRDQQR